MKIRVSSLRDYNFCPCIIYLRDVLKLESTPSTKRTRGLLGHAIRREMSLRQARLLSKAKCVEEIKPIILNELDKIIQDVPYIYREMLCDTEYQPHIDAVYSEIVDEIGVMHEKLRPMVNELGIDATLKRITPWKVEYSIKSANLKLSGRIDKVMSEDKGLIPIEIKTGKVSEGVWEGDRLQTCAYALLLEDKFDRDVPFGFVEYTRVHEKRPVMTTQQVRRRVINTRDSILDIINGGIPKTDQYRSENKCRVCGYRDVCCEV